MTKRPAASGTSARTTRGEIAPRAEIAERLWIDPAAPPKAPLAPLLETEVLPRL